MRLSIVIAVFVSLVTALSIDNTLLLWNLCQQSPECRDTFGVEAFYSIGTTPLDDGTKTTEQMLIEALQSMKDPRRMMEIPQFRAFQSVVFQQCALREADGLACSDEELEQLTAENLAANPLLGELWQVRLRLFMHESGSYCGPNYIPLVDPVTGALVCHCRLGKSCSEEFAQTLDGTFVEVLAFALAILLALTLLKDVFFFIKKRLWPEISTRATVHRKLYSFIKPPPADAPIPDPTPSAKPKPPPSSMMRTAAATAAAAPVRSTPVAARGLPGGGGGGGGSAATMSQRVLFGGK